MRADATNYHAQRQKIKENTRGQVKKKIKNFLKMY
jgi:hypothetical protein